MFLVFLMFQKVFGCFNAHQVCKVNLVFYFHFCCKIRIGSFYIIFSKWDWSFKIISTLCKVCPIDWRHSLNKVCKDCIIGRMAWNHLWRRISLYFMSSCFLQVSAAKHNPFFGLNPILDPKFGLSQVVLALKVNSY